MPLMQRTFPEQNDVPESPGSLFRVRLNPFRKPGVETPPMRKKDKIVQWKITPNKNMPKKSEPKFHGESIEIPLSPFSQSTDTKWTTDNNINKTPISSKSNTNHQQYIQSLEKWRGYQSDRIVGSNNNVNNNCNTTSARLARLSAPGIGSLRNVGGELDDSDTVSELSTSVVSRNALLRERNQCMHYRDIEVTPNVYYFYPQQQRQSDLISPRSQDSGDLPPQLSCLKHSNHYQKHHQQQQKNNEKEKEIKNVEPFVLSPLLQKKECMDRLCLAPPPPLSFSCENTPESDKKQIEQQKQQRRGQCISTPPSRPELHKTNKINCAKIQYVNQKEMIDSSGQSGTYTGTSSITTGLPMGTGYMKYKHGGSFDGQWVHGTWSGYGCLQTQTHDVYEGSFVDGSKHGQGCMAFCDGRMFVGLFESNQMIEGTMTYQTKPNATTTTTTTNTNTVTNTCRGDGVRYHGQFLKGQRHGQGVYHFEDGSVYYGEFDHDSMHGTGQLIWPGGGGYVGEWHHGIRQGFGKEFRPNGTVVHQGLWVNDSPDYNQSFRIDAQF